MQPVRDAFNSVGNILGVMLGGLIVLLTILLPVLGLVLAALAGKRRFRRWHGVEARAAAGDSPATEPPA